MKKMLWILALLTSAASLGAVTLPYTFSPGQTISSSQLNANYGALRDEINTHESQANGHNTTLSSVLTVNNSCGSTPINFNETQALAFRVENLSADPTCSSSYKGRLIFNTIDGLFKICDGTSFVSIAGTGVNTLASVLSAGNSAGSTNIDVNENQLLHARMENLSSDPSAGNAGRVWFNTSSNTLKLDTGSTVTAIGGAQGLSSVLGVSNSAGSTNIDFNGNQALNLKIEALSSDPGTTYAGRLYYNTASNQLRFYNGSSWLTVGNTNTLAQTLAIGNSAGSTDINFNSRQAQNMRLHNLAAPPGTGTAGILWYDTVTNTLGYETAGSNKTVCSLDDTQTLTNKTISGSSNTITNVQDSSLSANVDLLNGSQTLSGTKTFSAAPVISRIKTPAGTTLGHAVPNGLADDTFVLKDAVQTLSGKTLNAPTLSGNLDFAEFQGVNMRVENLASTPSNGNPGRIFYKTTTGELIYDDGTSWHVLTQNLSSSYTWSAILSNGNSAGAFNPDFNLNQALQMRLENLGSAPSAGNVGRISYNTASGVAQLDNGTVIKDLADTSTAQTLTNKTLTSPVINTPTLNGSGGALTLPAGPDTLVGRATTDTLTNKTLTSPTINTPTLNGSGGALTLPAGPDTIVGRATTDTLTNKTLSGASNTFTNIPNSATTATSANTPSAIVARDGSGNFSAGTITANLTGAVTGNASTATALAANPADCAAGNMATTIAANGDLTCTQVSDSYVAAGAAITRTKLANGTADHVLINDPSGVISSEAQLNRTRGGTGISSTATFPSSGVVVTEAATEALTNKDYDGGTASNASRITLPKASTATLSGLTRKQGTIVYDTDLNKPYYDNGTTLSPIGSGSGSGGANYILNPDAETGVTNVAAYADAAGTSPVDGNGGSPNITITRTTSSPLSGTGSFLITKDAANRQGQGVSWDFTVDRSALAKPMTISFDYEIASGTYDAGSDTTDPDLTAWVYGPTDGTPVVTQLAPYKVLGCASGVICRFQANLQTAASGTAYRLILHETKTGTSAYTFKLDNVSVSPVTRTFGAPVTDWNSNLTFTATGLGTISASTIVSRRVGDELDVRGIFTVGTSTAVNLTLNLPSGLSIDTTKLGSRQQRLGEIDRILSSSTAFPGTSTGPFPIYYDGSTSSGVFVAISAASNSYVAMLGNDKFSSGDKLTFHFRVPVAGWGSTVQLSQDAETRVVAARYTDNSGSQSIATGGGYTTVTFNTPIKDTHAAYSAGTITIPVAGWYDFKAQIRYDSAASANNQPRRLRLFNVTTSTPVKETFIRAYSGQTFIIVDLAGDQYFDAGTQVRFETNHGEAGSLTLGSSNCEFTIARRAGPASIAASESVGMRYNSSGGNTLTKSANNTVPFDTKSFDSHNAFVTDTWTAPMSGKYAVSASLIIASATWASGDLIELDLLVNGATKLSTTNYITTSYTGSYSAIPIVGDVPLNAGDTVKIQCFPQKASAGNVTVSASAPNNWFSIHRVGN